MWQDPVEHAFSVPVPAGWQVEGGIQRVAALDVRHQVVAMSPDGRILVRIGDTQIPGAFTPPNPMLAAAGLTEGQWYFPRGAAMGGQFILRYLPGVQFLTQWYLPQRVGRFTVRDEKDDVQLSQQVRAFQFRMGLQMQSQFGEVAFDAPTNEGLRKGYGFVETRATQMIWTVSRLWGYLSTPDAEPLAAAVLNQMVLGFRWNPQWGLAQIQSAGRIAQIQHQADQEINAMITQGYERRSLMQERMHERTIQAIRGETVIVDPTTHEHFTVPSGSNYFWRVQGGQEFIGTEQPTPPSLPNHWVEQMEIVQ